MKKTLSLVSSLLLSALTAMASTADSARVEPADSAVSRAPARLSLSAGGNDDFCPALTLDAIVTPPSPEAASMIRHIDEDVDFSSGTAGLHIPLYQWQSGDMSMSLSLSHAIGPHKTDEQPGWLGLGWNLSAAGCVTRSIVGFPDEMKTVDIRSDAAISSDGESWQYLIDLDEARKEGSLDRYSYSCPGASGSFVIRDNQIIQTPQTDNVIAFAGELTDGVRDFTVTTPDGTCYLFSEREHLDYQYKTPTVQPFRPLPDYQNAVSVWHLSRIISPEGADTVSYVYDTLPQWSRQKSGKDFNYSVSRSNLSAIPSVSSGNTSQFPSYAVTTFRDQKQLRSITSRTATVVFDNEPTPSADGASTPSLLKAIHVLTPEGNAVRDIEFSYATSYHKRNLAGVEIRSEGKLIDSHTFTYGSWTYDSPKDFFGYPNGAVNSASADQAVIDNNTGKFNRNRRPDTAAGAHCGELTQHVTAAGVTTRYSYEPNAMTYIRRNAMGTPTDTFTLAIGSRLRSIEDLDSQTKRRRLREFSYSDPMCTVNFDKVFLGDFVSVSGSRQISSGTAGSLIVEQIFTTDVTFHTSSLNPGSSPENASIYYGQVEERVSGTGIDTPVLTRYNYDTSLCLLDFTNAHRHSFGNTLLNDTGAERYPALENIPVNAPAGVRRAMMGNAIISGSFVEKPGVRPLLISATSFSADKGQYSPLQQSVYVYGRYDENAVLTSVFIHKGVRDLITVNLVRKHDCKSLADLDYCSASLRSFRSLCDSVITTRHFPDGSSRVSTTRFLRTLNPLLPFRPAFTRAVSDTLIHIDLTPTEYENPFRGDSIRITGSFRLPLGTRTTVAGHQLEHYTALSSNVTTSFFYGVSGRGRRSLPVLEMWVVDSRDTITRAWEYGVFNGVTRPTSVTLRGTSGAVIARQVITGYTSAGRPTGLRELGAPERRYAWDLYGQLLSLTEGSADGPSLTTSFTHKPLVGCTSVTAPDGSVTSYEYQGSRLTKVTGPEGNTLAEYAYGLYGETSGSLPRRNFIASTSYLNSASSAAAAGSVTETVYDGFGLQIAEISRNYGSGGDVASIVRYDALHRPLREWRPLPLAQLSDALSSDTPLSSASASLYGGDQRAFTASAYPLSAQEIPASVTAPGTDFASHPSATELTCSASDEGERRVTRYSFDGSTLRRNGYYAAGELDCLLSTDADGRVSLTFTDVLGRTVLSRRIADDGTFADTYIVADSWGHPLIVIPPEASKALASGGTSETDVSDDLLQDYAFIYSYDKAFRVRSARTPGCQPLRYAYDRDGRLAFTRDGNQAQKGRRSFIARDALGRMVLTGTCDDALSDDIWDSDLSASTLPLTLQRTSAMGHGLLGSGYAPVSGSGAGNLVNASLLTASYHDDYSFLPDSISQIYNPPISSPVPAASERGRTTGTLTALLGSAKDIPAGCASLLLVQRHDRSGNVIRSVSGSIDGSIVTTTVTSTCGGLPLSADLSISKADGSYLRGHRIDRTYDTFGRPVQTSLTVGSQSQAEPLLLSSLTYNALGEPCRSESHGGFTLQSERNIRGHLFHWQAPGIEQSILYGDDGRYPSHSGRITAKVTAVEGLERRYDYQYSSLGFLTRADFSSRSLDSLTKLSNNFSAEYGYDLNANLTQIARYGGDGSSLHTLPILNVILDGNRIDMIKLSRLNLVQESDQLIGRSGLTPVKDPVIAVRLNRQYDANGNLTYDPDRNIQEIAYNDINRPERVRFWNGDEIRYVYAATGEKLAEYHCSANGSSDRSRLWIGGYETVDGNVERLLLEQGYLDLATSGLYIYVQDYQGNVAAVYDCSSRSLVQTTDYYPYGKPHPDGKGAELQRRKYGAKEYLSEFSLAEYDFDARRLITSTGTFSQPDPLAGALTHPETGKPLGMPYLASFSPYSYCAGDPINLIDPTGMNGVRIIDDENRSIIIRAIYYVVTEGISGTSDKPQMTSKGYSESDIAEMKKLIQEINDLGLTIPKGEYEGYTLTLELSFEGAGIAESTTAANNAFFEGKNIGNTIQQRNKYNYYNPEYSFEIKTNLDGSYEVRGGVTDLNKDIVMNIDVEQFESLNIVHEIFHTLGLTHPEGRGASSGIMHYPPQKLNGKDIMNLVKNPLLDPRK